MMLVLGYQHQIHRRLKISAAQRLAIDTALLTRKRALVGALHGGSFTPKATCPGCGHGLKDLEIMRGFMNDPRDYTTKCPRCKHRFAPRLVRRIDISTTEVAMYCPMQTLDQLPALVDIPVEEFCIKHAGVYHSALLHFGGLAQAFQRVGLAYAHAADLDWKKVAQNFLGKLADAVIGRLVGASAAAVGKLRRSLSIGRYRITHDL